MRMSASNQYEKFSSGLQYLHTLLSIGPSITHAISALINLIVIISEASRVFPNVVKILPENVKCQQDRTMPKRDVLRLAYHLPPDRQLSGSAVGATVGGATAVAIFLQTV